MLFVFVQVVAWFPHCLDLAVASRYVTHFPCAAVIYIFDSGADSLQVINIKQKCHRVKKCTLWYSSLKMTPFWCCRSNFYLLSTITKEACNPAGKKVRHTLLDIFDISIAWSARLKAFRKSSSSTHTTFSCDSSNPSQLCTKLIKANVVELPFKEPNW